MRSAILGTCDTGTHSGMVDGSRVEAIAALVRGHFGSAVPMAAKWDDPAFWNVEADRVDRCQFLAVGNAVNFRFWDLRGNVAAPTMGTVSGETFRGSMYLWRRLRSAISEGEFSLDARYLAELTTETFQTAFEDDAGFCPLHPAIEDRVSNLRDLGARLLEAWQGQFVNVVDAAQGSLERFATLSRSFRAFDDPVRKLTMVNAIMLTGSGLANFDRDPLPGVDYHLMKQAVRQGLVEPSADVGIKLAEGGLLTADEALSLRHSVLDALVRVADTAGVSTAVLDNLYWNNRRVCSDRIPACRSGAIRCPFELSCAQRTEFGLPLELTRYY
jgi:hypothetical protein